LNDPVKEVLPGRRVRRRRSWYSRRLRVQRLMVAMLVGVVLAAACWQSAARYFFLPTLHASQVLPASIWARPNLHNVHNDLALAAARSNRPAKGLARIPGVYPYSVIPGGVKSLSDLRYAAMRDYVVRRHYAHFDFEHAQLVRAREAREVYLSYRIRNTVFWTRKKIRLHPGELLLTDGNMTARARCGNQISDIAKPEVSDEEPDEDALDQPVVAAEPNFGSPIRPMLAPPELPAGDVTAPKLFAAGFIFPYVPVSVPLPSGRCPANDQIVDGKCRPKHKNPVIPEPSTTLLLGTGLTIVLWRYRKALRAVRA
jgi:hypothetical protein